MSLALGLRADVRFCLVGSRAIFIDIASERYFGLPAQMDRAFQRLFDPAPLSAFDEAALQPLIDRGLLVPNGNATVAAAATCTPDAVSDLMGNLPQGVTSSTIALALWSELVIALAYRRLSLRGIEARLRSWRRERPKRVRQPKTDIRTYQQLAAAFDKTGLLFHPADRCLPKALAFILACRSRHLYPSLVFGVRASPFAAHCWVQHGTLILNDELERVRIFTPILVL